MPGRVTLFAPKYGSLRRLPRLWGMCGSCATKVVRQQTPQVSQNFWFQNYEICIISAKWSGEAPSTLCSASCQWPAPGLPAAASPPPHTVWREPFLFSRSVTPSSRAQVGWLEVRSPHPARGSKANSWKKLCQLFWHHYFWSLRPWLGKSLPEPHPRQLEKNRGPESCPWFLQK